MTLTKELTIDGKDYHVTFYPHQVDLLLFDYSNDDGKPTHWLMDGGKMLSELIEQKYAQLDSELDGQLCTSVTDADMEEGFNEFVESFLEENSHLIIKL